MLRSLLPRYLRPHREKVFGDGPRVPLDREAKVRIMHFARALKHRTEPRQHYGVLTGKFVDVLHALLWLIHDGRSGQCNPAYATIADKAGCAPSTVGEAIKALEDAGILGWVNRIRRIGSRERDLFGHWATTWRVVRTSNAYVFHDPKLAAQRGRPSNTEFRSGPPDTNTNKDIGPSYPQPSASPPQPSQGGARLAGARVTQDLLGKLAPDRRG
jgi:DNA-binding MarR family transcriptional regulator